MKVLKFGGTSVGSAQNIKKIKDILNHQEDDMIVVVSAFSGMTDKILSASRMALMGAEYFKSEYQVICDLHLQVVDELFEGKQGESVRAHVQLKLQDLGRIIEGVSMIKELSPKTQDKICCFGEQLSSFIISEFIGVPLIDAFKFIKTDQCYGRANVDFNLTNTLIQSAFENYSGCCVVPGFVASASDGSRTTLGRGGSDYTAAIFAAALRADALEIWTDVDGFMTADPKVISKAYVIESLSYTEAMELSHFGAKVIYPPTILPVYQQNIPTYIKNTFNPSAKGTIIHGSVAKNKYQAPIRGISSISDICLVTVQGLGMIGVSGMSMRLFQALAKEDINVILISQASSENSISIAIDSSKAAQAEAIIRLEFEKEIAVGRIHNVEVETNLSVVAIVGENMKQSTGIAGKLFTTLGRSGINVVAIAQGASEVNISFVVKTSNLRKTLNLVHESFFLSENAELNVFLLGIGLVGGSLLCQILQQQEKLLASNRLKIKVVGIANSKKMIINREGIDLMNYKELLDTEGADSSLRAYKEEIIGLNIYNSVFVDCTASGETQFIYPDLLAASVSIVTANKVAASSKYENYKMLKDLASNKGVKFLFETNVGAGLPIINTISDLVKSGDRVIKIEAVLSGTLNYIFNTISADVPLSETIRLAKEEGYAEPDPRIDLSGVDVMRKLLILVRESGYKIDGEDVKVNKFISDEFFAGTIDEFWASISQLDAEFEKNRQRIDAEGKCWRFVATYDNGRAEIGLQEIDKSHPFYDLQGSNNLVMFTTERYNEYPMIIKGYGAGAEVTAAGVFADIIRISNI
ncbi:MAG: bifunctional aspartate kinase/homoserine dehydrogenase I [Mangrovibacterium sp.]